MAMLAERMAAKRSLFFIGARAVEPWEANGMLIEGLVSMQVLANDSLPPSPINPQCQHSFLLSQKKSLPIAAESPYPVHSLLRRLKYQCHVRCVGRHLKVANRRSHVQNMSQAQRA